MTVGLNPSFTPTPQGGFMSLEIPRKRQFLIGVHREPKPPVYISLLTKKAVKEITHITSPAFSLFDDIQNIFSNLSTGIKVGYVNLKWNNVTKTLSQLSASTKLVPKEIRITNFSATALGWVSNVLNIFILLWKMGVVLHKKYKIQQLSKNSASKAERQLAKELQKEANLLPLFTEWVVQIATLLLITLAAPVEGGVGLFLSIWTGYKAFTDYKEAKKQCQAYDKAKVALNSKKLRTNAGLETQFLTLLKNRASKKLDDLTGNVIVQTLTSLSLSSLATYSILMTIALVLSIPTPAGLCFLLFGISLTILTCTTSIGLSLYQYHKKAKVREEKTATINKILDETSVSFPVLEGLGVLDTETTMALTTTTDHTVRHDLLAKKIKYFSLPK